MLSQSPLVGGLPVEVFYAVDLTGSVHSKGHTIQTLSADHTREARRVIRLARGSQHLCATQRHKLTNKRRAPLQYLAE